MLIPVHFENLYIYIYIYIYICFQGWPLKCYFLTYSKPKYVDMTGARVGYWGGNSLKRQVCLWPVNNIVQINHYLFFILMDMIKLFINKCITGEVAPNQKNINQTQVLDLP